VELGFNAGKRRIDCRIGETCTLQLSLAYPLFPFDAIEPDRT
jgi:hypothetical protein